MKLIPTIKVSLAIILVCAAIVASGEVNLQVGMKREQQKGSLTARQVNHLAAFGERWAEKIQERKRVNSEADRQAILATRPN